MFSLMPPHLDALISMCRGRRITVLTGAGCSTESGIPDYRGPKTRQLARNPVQYAQFIKEPQARQRYWARSFMGWPKWSKHQPNQAHEVLARAERDGVIQGVITQNVDRLHHKAGSERVVELHGALAQVRCLDCQGLTSRDALQARLEALNPDFARSAGQLSYAPDGDVDLSQEALYSIFNVPSCERCQGILKPDVVFFGENVPKAVVERAWALFDEAQVLLVVGSSLTVYSGYRFALKASQRALPTALLNIGPTRADGLDGMLKIEARAGEVLPLLFDAL